MTEAQDFPPLPLLSALSLSLSEAIEAIKVDSGTHPEDAINVILHHRDEAIPQLIEILRDIINDPKAFWEHNNYRVLIYALELLSKFQATEAHTTITSLVALPGDIVREIFGDYLYTLLPETLVNTSTGDWSELKRLIELETDPEANEAVPLSAVDALFLSVLCGKADRVEVLDYLATILKNQDLERTMIYRQVIEVMAGLYPEKHMDLLHQVLSRRPNYESSKKNLDEMFLDGLERTLELSRAHLAEHHYPDDIHERLLMSVDEDDCCSCGHEHHHGHHHHHTSLPGNRPQKHALPRNQRLKNKKKLRSNQRQARKRTRRK
jgi:hypothetical protein